MTKRECAERNTKRDFVFCQYCKFKYNGCDLNKNTDECEDFCKQWLKDNPEIPELKPILCEVWEEGHTKRVQRLVFGEYEERIIALNTVTGRFSYWDHAEPIKEKTKRPMTREEKEEYVRDNIDKVLDIFDFPEVEE